MTDHLTASQNHVVKIEKDGIKLFKKGSKRRYAFNLEEIVKKYGSIANFLQSLPAKGFDSQVVFTLQKTYGTPSKTTYHLVQKITEDLIPKDMNEQEYTASHGASSITANTHNFLGAPELVAKMVEAERSADYKEQVQELKERVKDLRSRNRSLEEKNNSLKLKLDTAKEREELRVERELLKKKSFLETPAFEKTMETLGGVIPKVLEVAGTNANNMASSQVGLSSPNISQVHKAFIQKLSSTDVNDEQILFFNYLLDNWKEDLITYTANYIEEKE
ncbi:bZIP transcription factor [uncultured Tenacibaculum sp.]|uniref:bZIP transcription factor n=1 Tax=uncultured Tenacibaculum sp. TaxID=174713 RepID=UPI00260C7BF8|nr:bZIP transcription factor [uncultured Tenacibaculum sp.]